MNEICDSKKSPTITVNRLTDDISKYQQAYVGENDKPPTLDNKVDHNDDYEWGLAHLQLNETSVDKDVNDQGHNVGILEADASD